MLMKDFTPSLLLSMPQMQDPNFARTVVLLCDYRPEGAFGLVINRPTDVAARRDGPADPPVAAVGATAPCALFVGGPVQPERGWILLAEPPMDAECRTIQDGLYLSASPEVLRDGAGARRRRPARRSSPATPAGDRDSSTRSWRSRRG